MISLNVLISLYEIFKCKDCLDVQMVVAKIKMEELTIKYNELRLKVDEYTNDVIKFKLVRKEFNKSHKDLMFVKDKIITIANLMILIMTMSDKLLAIIHGN